MACYRCGQRQPERELGRGSDPWRQGVIGDRQVLICPDCQLAGEWAAELDRCAVCGSVCLVRRLGEVECGNCGATGEATRPAAGSLSAARPDAQTAGLSEEVERALARVLLRVPGGRAGDGSG